MPNVTEHSESCYRKYGVSGEDIHHWMDETVTLAGSGHRSSRHSLKQKIPQLFIEKYGEDLARYIMEDHILLDSKTKMGVDEISTPQIKIVEKIVEKIVYVEKPIESTNSKTFPSEKITGISIDENAKIDMKFLISAAKQSETVDDFIKMIREKRLRTINIETDKDIELKPQVNESFENWTNRLAATSYALHPENKRDSKVNDPEFWKLVERLEDKYGLPHGVNNN